MQLLKHYTQDIPLLFCFVEGLNCFIIYITAAAYWWETNICFSLVLPYPKCLFSVINRVSSLNVAKKILTQLLFMYLHSWSVLLPSSTWIDSLYLLSTFKIYLCCIFSSSSEEGEEECWYEIDISSHFDANSLKQQCIYWWVSFIWIFKWNEWNHL